MSTKKQQTRFRGKGYHLTYKGWLDHTFTMQQINLRLVARSAKLKLDPPLKLKWYSFVHETGHGQETPYNHTHIAIRLDVNKPIDMVGADCFDVIDRLKNKIHPNIQPIQNPNHERSLFYDYHKKSPVFLFQTETGPEKEDEIEQLINASCLAEAVRISGIEIKSVSDINLLRNAADAPVPFVHKYSEEDTEWLVKIRSPDWRVLFIWGLTNTGKTQFALSLFKNPLLVRHIDQIRGFNPKFHDGLVFDDMCFVAMAYENIIHLLDADEDTIVPCRYSPGKIPRDTKRVFTSNKPFNMVFGVDEHGALKRRIDEIIHINGPCYSIKENIEPTIPTSEITPMVISEDDARKLLHDPLMDTAMDDVTEFCEWIEKGKGDMSGFFDNHDDFWI